MSYESNAEPIKLGYLFDFRLPDGYPREKRDDLTQPFELVFNEGLKQGVIDRAVEIVFREVEGLPKGTSKAVIDAYGELVEEGCLAVFGPSITDNAVPTREAIEQRFHVPAISVSGSDDWLGERTFALPQGSMTDEPIFWAELIKRGGHTEVTVEDPRGDRHGKSRGGQDNGPSRGGLRQTFPCRGEEGGDDKPAEYPATSRCCHPATVRCGDLRLDP